MQTAAVERDAVLFSRVAGLSRAAFPESLALMSVSMLRLGRENSNVHMVSHDSSRTYRMHLIPYAEGSTSN